IPDFPHRRLRRFAVDETVLLAYLRLDLLRDVAMIGEIFLGVLATLADALALERVPSAALLDDAALRTEIDDLAVARDAESIDDVELRLLERRRHLVLHDPHLGAAADDVVSVLDVADAADVEPH